MWMQNQDKRTNKSRQNKYIMKKKVGYKISLFGFSQLQMYKDNLAGLPKYERLELRKQWDLITPKNLRKRTLWKLLSSCLVVYLWDINCRDICNWENFRRKRQNKWQCNPSKITLSSNSVLFSSDILVYLNSSIRLCGKVRKLLCRFIEECGSSWIVPNTCVTSGHVVKMAACAK